GLDLADGHDDDLTRLRVAPGRRVLVEHDAVLARIGDRLEDDRWRQPGLREQRLGVRLALATHVGDLRGRRALRHRQRDRRALRDLLAGRRVLADDDTLRLVRLNVGAQDLEALT